ncbi:hypothetical protein FRX31_012818 [Thalictrum thalictroides]|uniref:Uncharacterized protein n=1 Tax=Thalictrum thalictroides TaxID=46969 RepID=A0A7J6WJN2_THATH|nr:hypothetical protein FRX31_012818 [Thalictrum thalictroides]
MWIYIEKNVLIQDKMFRWNPYHPYTTPPPPPTPTITTLSSTTAAIILKISSSGMFLVSIITPVRDVLTSSILMTFLQDLTGTQIVKRVLWCRRASLMSTPKQQKLGFI